MTLVIRAAAQADAPELTRLLQQLGHPTSLAMITAHWRDWSAAGNSALVSVRADGTLAGVATLHHMIVLHRPKPVGRITALVVDEGERGRGVGRALVFAAEQALANAGCGLLEITSNVRRLDAHAFYEHLGYERTSIRVSKTLAASH